jgi:hypothetical protein
MHVGLIGYWKLDTNAGSIAVDSSGMGNDGVIEGAPALVTTGLPTPLMSFDKAAFAFHATDDAVEVRNQSPVTLTELTLSLWVRFASNSNHLGCGGPPSTLQFLLYRPNARTTGNLEGVALIRTQDNQFGFILGDNANNRTEVDGLPMGAATVSTGVWYHVAATFSNMQMRLYVNGVLASNGTPQGAIVSRGPAPVDLGARSLFLGRSGECSTLEGIGVIDWDAELDGTLDDVRFYNRALSGLDIAALYGGADL